MIGEALLGTILAKLWLLVAAFIGAMTGAYFIRPRTRLEWLFTIGGGFFASVFVAPAAVAYTLPGVPGSDGRVGAIYYSFALFAMIVIPPFMRGLEKWAEKRGEKGIEP